MNEDTVAIALHGTLSAAEHALAQSPAGAAQVREFHRHLFASEFLHRKIKTITGMEVRDTIAEIEPTTGGVVQVLTTDTVAEEFQRPPSEGARTRAPRHARPRRPEDSARLEVDKPGCVIRR
jgi:uncharacterized protein YbcI